MPKTATPRKPETLSRKLAEARNTSSNRSLPKLGDNEKRLLADIISGVNDVSGRGMIAGMLGMPGDIAGLAENGLRALLGKPQVQPWGGSEHIGQKMQDYGLVSDVRRPKTELLASLISPSAAAKTILNAPKTARNALLALDNLTAPRTMANYGQRGAIDVWHGSPHKFDTFKAMDNIGGGEGAQAYGHGGYHASRKGVGESYMMSTSRPEVDVGGRSFKADASGVFRDENGNVAGNMPDYIYSAMTGVVGSKPGIPITQLAEEVESFLQTRHGLSQKHIEQAKSAILNGDVVQKSNGNLYRNQLRWPDPAREAADPLSDKHFLDWDKPLSEQNDLIRGLLSRGVSETADGYSPSVSFMGADIPLPVTYQQRQTADDYWKYVDTGNFKDDFGSKLVEGARNKLGAKEFAEKLRDLGIPGIRYLDGGSRSAGQGSHNYVTFDDNLVNILERNGQPVTAPQPGLLGKMVAPQDEALRVADEAPPSIFREGRDGLFGGNVDYVARERFNIPALKKISSGGSDRDVYDLGNDHVLKVAKSARGLAQNDASDYYLSNAGILPEAIETGENYIVTKKMLPPDANTKKLVNGLKQFNHQDWRNNSDRLQQYLEDNNLSDILNYDVMHGDIAAVRNWGTTPEGLPIHLDEGTFNAGILDEFRGVTNMQNDDFRKVHAKSKAAKKKYGDKDKATMYGLLAPVGLGALIAQPKERKKKKK